jgi:hypothetical protein
MGEGGAVVSEVRRLVFLRDQEKVADMERERKKERPRRGVKGGFCSSLPSVISPVCFEPSWAGQGYKN